MVFKSSVFRSHSLSTRETILFDCLVLTLLRGHVSTNVRGQIGELPQSSRWPAISTPDHCALRCSSLILTCRRQPRFIVDFHSSALHQRASWPGSSLNRILGFIYLTLRLSLSGLFLRFCFCFTAIPALHIILSPELTPSSPFPTNPVGSLQSFLVVLRHEHYWPRLY